MRYIRKAPSLFFLLFILISTSSFTFHQDTITSIGTRVSTVVSNVKNSIQHSSISMGENFLRAAGVEKAELIYPQELDLPEPVFITEPITCVTIAPESIIAKILQASPLNASGMTLNPIGIMSIGEMPEGKLKEELYHWWDASRTGPFRYYSSYVLEFGALCITNLSSDTAYTILPFEKSAKKYAYQP